VSKPVVLIAEELSPATVDALGPDFEIRHCHGADRAELLPAIADVDAVLVRSATRIDAEAVAAAKKLKVVARAGVGLDNVDVPAATKAGVMVVNAPTSNIVTAAELACGLIISTARHIPQANAALKGGEWKRSKYTGVELSEKTLGVVGLGRIGVLVAQRMAAFGMKVVAYDPFVQPARAAQMGVRLMTLDELLGVSDFVTVHLPKTPETLGLIDDEALHKVKPSVRIVNAARGGIVDEEALAAALKEGRVAGAGLDVYSSEPCTDSPLFEFDQVVCTPHLGASTGEAQEKAGIAVARSVRLALAGEVAVRLDVEVYGEITQHDVKVLELSALKGVFEDVVDDTVSYVNAPLFAQERGVEVRLTTSSESPDHRNLVTVRGTLTGGEEVSVSGTLAGPKHLQKIVAVGEHDVDLALADHMVFLRYGDRPGVVGTVGRVLGEAGINIAGMQVSRATAGGEALVALTVDDTVPQAVLAEMAGEIGATFARSVDLGE
jgi:D-3-phosphoglycerate dehydrogenase